MAADLLHKLQIYHTRILSEEYPRDGVYLTEIVVSLEVPRQRHVENRVGKTAILREPKFKRHETRDAVVFADAMA